MALPFFMSFRSITFTFYDKNGPFLCFLGKFYLRIIFNRINELVNKIFIGI